MLFDYHFESLGGLMHTFCFSFGVGHIVATGTPCKSKPRYYVYMVRTNMVDGFEYGDQHSVALAACGKDTSQFFSPQ
jgi:hypothetical protein